VAFTSGLVLQDIINELGRRLDYQVENGLYQGRPKAFMQNVMDELYTTQMKDTAKMYWHVRLEERHAMMSDSGSLSIASVARSRF
jgi:hypothetical protein